MFLDDFGNPKEVTPETLSTYTYDLVIFQLQYLWFQQKHLFLAWHQAADIGGHRNLPAADVAWHDLQHWKAAGHLQEAVQCKLLSKELEILIQLFH